MQLDIFANSRDTELRNEVIEALLRCDFPLARIAMTALSTEYPLDRLLSPAETLLAVDALPDEVGDHPSLTVLIDRCDQEIAVAATAALGQKAAAWMGTHVWSRLAEASTGLPFSQDYPDAFVAALWLRASEWNRASASVDRIDSWRCIPVPLRWKIIATVRTGNLDVAWPWIFELAWMAPNMLTKLVDNLKDPVLRRMMVELDRILDGADSAAWFPAFALIAEPSLVPRATSAQPAKDSDATRAYAYILSLLALERQGRQTEIADTRKKLRGLNDQLFRRYMETR